MPALSSAEIEKALIRLPDWQLNDALLNRTFNFIDFREAMSFVNSSSPSP